MILVKRRFVSGEIILKEDEEGGEKYVHADVT